MATENLTTYTEVDSEGRYTVTSSRVTFTGLERADSGYVYGDKGAAHFDALDIDATLVATGASGGTLSACAFGVSNAVDDLGGWSTNEPQVWAFIGTDTSHWSVRLVLNSGADVTADYTLSTIRHVTLSRSTGNDTVNVLVYSDAPRTSLLDTITRTGAGTQTYRYAYAAVARGNTPSLTNSISGYIENIDLNEAETTHSVSGAIEADGDIAGALDATHPVSGDIAGIALVAAALSKLTHLLAGDMSADGDVTALLHKLDIPLSGSVAADGDMSAFLRAVGSGQFLSGDIAASGDLSALLRKLDIVLGCSIDADGEVSAGLYRVTDLGLEGDMSGIGTVIAGLSGGSAVTKGRGIWWKLVT